MSILNPSLRDPFTTFDVGTGNREDLLDIICNGDDEDEFKGCGLKWLWRICPCRDCKEYRRERNR